MKPRFTLLLAVVITLVVLLSSCGPRATPTTAPPTDMPTATLSPSFTPLPPLPSATPTITPVPATATPSNTPTPVYPVTGRGPENFAPEVNPLTGLEVADPDLLNRRPVVIKVENLPRSHRPQWGLSLADLVYEYYTEFGATRFAAVFYGQDASMVAPIRSGRFFDSNVVQMYKGVFVYGSAYPDVNQRFFNSDFARRLILETTNSCPALCRYDPGGDNLLAADTAALLPYLQSRSVDNTRQNQDGMFFQMQAPTGGDSGSQVFVRYSGAIYNRWDYDAATGRYLRFSDAQNDVNRQNEVYEQLTDRLTDDPVTAENVVMMCVPHLYYVKRADAEVMDIVMDAAKVPSYAACDGQVYKGNSGPAYIARDGKLYKVTWQRSRSDSVLTLLNPDGSVFPFKPGQTWFEVLGAASQIQQQDDGAWRFNHLVGQY